MHATPVNSAEWHAMWCGAVRWRGIWEQKTRDEEMVYPLSRKRGGLDGLGLRNQGRRQAVRLIVCDRPLGDLFVAGTDRGTMFRGDRQRNTGKPMNYL